MEQANHKKKNQHALTPSSRQKNIHILGLIKSPEKKLKRKDSSEKKPSQSTNKALSLSKNLPLNPGSKSSTPKSSKVGNHRRFLSSIERPTSTSDSKKGIKKQGRRKFSLDPLYLSPVVCKYSFDTKTGYIPGNTQKTNQDNYFAHVNFANQPDMYLFGVCDGHGFYGGEVSGFIKQRLPIIMAEHSEIITNTKKAITASIHKVNYELSQINLDIKFSGSTLILILIRGNALFCANVGDSRALLARQMVDDVEKSIAIGKR